MDSPFASSPGLAPRRSVTVQEASAPCTRAVQTPHCTGGPAMGSPPVAIGRHRSSAGRRRLASRSTLRVPLWATGGAAARSGRRRVLSHGGWADVFQVGSRSGRALRDAVQRRLEARTVPFLEKVRSGGVAGVEAFAGERGDLVDDSGATRPADRDEAVDTPGVLSLIHKTTSSSQRQRQCCSCGGQVGGSQARGSSASRRSSSRSSGGRSAARRRSSSAPMIRADGMGNGAMSGVRRAISGGALSAMTRAWRGRRSCGGTRRPSLRRRRRCCW
jgi:hypothetical protein